MSIRIYLGDLGHYTVILRNNYIPLNIGFIAAYTQHHLKDNVDIQLFKNPFELIKAIDKYPPDILGLSNYVWCHSISDYIFQYYKKIKKSGCTVWGGPNFPMTELHKAKEFMLSKPYVDFYIPYEGEIPFLNIAKSILQYGNNSDKLKDDHTDLFEGAFFLRKKQELIGIKIGIQIPNLDIIPSPFLKGWMDPFLVKNPHIIFETQRGCPYQCTFCHNGLEYYNKGRSFSLHRTIEEIKYITDALPDPTKVAFRITDNNFGMWPQDLEFTKFLNEHYKKTGFPLLFHATTGKSRSDRVLETVFSHPKLMLTNSVQSLDDTVLKTIKRHNLPYKDLKNSQEELDKHDKMSWPEVILGLPNETRQSHIETLRKLVTDIEANMIFQYTLMLLPGTELEMNSSREKFKYKTKFRLLPLSFGEYTGKRVFEIEEVSVGTKDFSYEEYLDMRELFFFVHNVHSNAIFRPMLRYLIYLEYDIMDFFLYMMKKRRLLKNTFPGNLITEYLRDTESELFNSKEELISFYSRNENYTDLLEEKKGNNQTHFYRLAMLLEGKKWVNFVNKSFSEYLEEKASNSEIIKQMAHSIKIHINAQATCQLQYFQKGDLIPTKEKPLKAKLDFDIPKIFSKKVDSKTTPYFKKEKTVYSYFMRNDAIKFIKSLPPQQTKNTLALTLIRMDQYYVAPLFARVD